MKKLLFLLLFFPVFLSAQNSAYFFAGARSFKVDTAAYQSGPDVGIGLMVENMGEEIGWFASARITYMSVSTGGIPSYEGLSFRGGAGVQSVGDNARIGMSLNMNYLSNFNTSRANDAFGMDFGGIVQVPLKVVELFAEAQLGVIFNQLVLGGRSPVPYVGGGMGVKYIFK